MFLWRSKKELQDLNMKIGALTTRVRVLEEAMSFVQIRAKVNVENITKINGLINDIGDSVDYMHRRLDIHGFKKEEGSRD